MGAAPGFIFLRGFAFDFLICRNESISVGAWEGDLLEANFGTGYDVAILGHILHSEGEERSRKLLKKTFRALKSGGVIAIAEWLVNDQRTEPLHALMFAVQMLVNTEKGDTFSFNEIKSWLEDAGFRKVRRLEAPGPSPLILATKP